MSCRCPIIKPKPERAVVKPCENCDTCAPADSTVRLCAFTVPTLEEGRYYKNSFVYVEEENTTYYISDDRSEIPFGTRPYYIDDFDPDAPGPAYKKALVYDLKNKALYIYDANGNMLRVSLEAEVRLVAGKGIVITNNDGEYTISTDGTFATHEDLEREIGIEASERTAADQNLQSQIDTIVNSSDVKDVVGTKAELDSYDTSTLGQNDIVKVLADETEDGATTYYRYSTATQSFTLVGEIGPYYTKGEMDEKLQTKVVTGFSGISSGSSDYNIKYLLGQVGSKSAVESSFALPYAGRTGAGPLSRASYEKFDDAANQTETNRHDISDVKGDISELEVDKLGVDNLIAGNNITIVKEGNDENTTLTISAEGGGGDAIKFLTEADYNYPTDNPTSINPYYLPQGLYQIKFGVARRGATAAIDAIANQDVFLISRDQNNGVRMYVFGDVGRGGDGASTFQMFSLAGAAGVSAHKNAVFSQDVVNNLNSDSTIYPLSANMGRELKAMIDAIPSGGGGITTLTEADYDFPDASPTGVAAWRLEPGMYQLGGGLSVWCNNSTRKQLSADATLIVTRGADNAEAFIYYFYPSDGPYQFVTNRSAGAKVSESEFILAKDVVNNFTTTSQYLPLSANQGKLLNDRVTALEQGGGSGVKVVQSIGKSTTDVMSQRAATEMVFGRLDTNYLQSIEIGEEASASSSASNASIAIGRNATVGISGIAIGNNSVTNSPEGVSVGSDSEASPYAVAIGKSAKAKANYSTALGYSAGTSEQYATALGNGAKADAIRSVALGDHSVTSAQGEVSVGGDTLGTNGYNGTSYRKITNVYDPEDDHDAATKAYVDAHAGGGETITNDDWSALWQ